MRCSAFLNALLFASVVDATSLEASALAADDECLAEGSAACALNALQLRGQAKQAAVEISAAEAAAEAADLVAEAADSARLAAEVTQALSLELGNKHPVEDDAEDATAASEDASQEVFERDGDAEGDADGATAEGLHGEEREEAMDEIPVEVVQEEANRADTYPDLSTGMDSEGPYLEMPSEEQDKNPATANMSLIQMKAADAWGGASFCESHHTGSFCQETTQIRCCKKDYGYVKCGSTWHSTGCGWHEGGGGMHDDRRRSYYDDRRRSYDARRRMYYSGGGSGGGGVWHVHQGWHASSYCTSHHVGFFCSSHRKIHCCSDYGHFVDCTTHQESSYNC